MEKKALLVGSSGLIGSNCLSLLLNDPYYDSVEIFVRKPSGISHPKMIEKVMEFKNLPNISATNANHVYCCLGTTIAKAKTKDAFREVDFEYTLQTAKLAERSNCEKFLVISSLGANNQSNNFYLRTKGEMEFEIKKLSIPGIYIFRPSILLGNRKEFRLGEIIGKAIIQVIGFLFIGKFKKYKGIKASEVALSMIRNAKDMTNGIIIFESDKIR